ncbi:CHAT domain-containing protein [Streptosporangiaceae bacterium NEAU-GS5]|nr:CHAT domain-containing protein [Streptosporangiaceae bacterium NEAU-GS5]
MITSVIRVDDLIGGDGAGHYPVSLYTDQSGGDPVAQCELPDPGDLETLRGVLLASVPNPAARLAAGRSLYQLIAGTAVGQAWGALLAGPDRIRTVFDMRAGALRTLPWELMLAPTQKHPFLDDAYGCVRGSFRPGVGPGFLVPIRVLIVVGDAHDPNLRASDEVDAVRWALREGLGAWHVEVLTEPSPDELVARFKALKPHVFHFIGHGTWEDGSPALQLGPAAANEPLTSYYMANSEVPAPRLVFLNACRTTSAAGPADAQAVGWGVAAAFEDLGADAVLTMQGDIASPSAVRFAGALYAALAEGKPVDLAVRSARRDLFRKQDDAWALPSLIVRRHPEQVLPWQLGPGVDRDAVVKIAKQEKWYTSVGQTVDRVAEHWALWDGPDVDAPGYQACLVGGEPEVGKSSLVRSCVFTWCLRGSQAVYVDVKTIKDGRTVSWVDVVRALVDALAGRLPGRAELPARRFRHQLVHLRQGRRPPTVGDDELTPDDNGPWEAETEEEGALRKELMAALRALLAEVAGGRPLTIALDHLARVLEHELTGYLVPGLLMPIAEGEVADVRLIVAERTKDARRLLGDFPMLARSCEVQPFRRAQAEELFREYSAMICRPYEGEWRMLVEQVSRLAAARLDPSDLSLLNRLARQA